eukprot:2876921-Rhodomonas_salina.1
MQELIDANVDGMRSVLAEADDRLTKGQEEALQQVRAASLSDRQSSSPRVGLPVRLSMSCQIIRLCVT